MTSGIKKVLITGGSGLLGRYLLRTAPDEYEVHATYCNNPVPGVRWQMDVRNCAQVHKVFDFVQPDIVIHAAGNGSVDRCENSLEAGYGVNIYGTYGVMCAAKECGAKFVYISSNAVFDGKHAPYAEDDDTNPVNFYGHSKLLVERAVQRFLSDWLIVRPIMLYGWSWPGGRSNWATRVVEMLRHDKQMNVVTDIVTQPTYARDCALAIWKLLDKDNGIWHVGGRARTWLYTYARIVASVFDLDEGLLHSVGSGYFSDLAPRPRDSTYRISKLLQAGIDMPVLREGLQRMKDEELELIGSDVHT